MNNILTGDNKEEIIRVSQTRTLLLLEKGAKESTVFCLGHNKHRILLNINLYIQTSLNILKEKNYRVNSEAYDIIRKVYLQRLSERVGSLDGKTLDNCPGLSDVVKFTLACSMDGIPAIFLSIFPNPNLNTSDCGKFEQPESTIRVPLIHGCDSIFIPPRRNYCPFGMYGVSRENLKIVRESLRNVFGNDTPLKMITRDKNNEFTPQRQGREKPRIEYFQEDCEIPKHVSHESTIVDTIRAVRPTTYKFK